MSLADELERKAEECKGYAKLRCGSFGKLPIFWARAEKELRWRAAEARKEEFAEIDRKKAVRALAVVNGIISSDPQSQTDNIGRSVGPELW